MESAYYQNSPNTKHNILEHQIINRNGSRPRRESAPLNVYDNGSAAGRRTGSIGSKSHNRYAKEILNPTQANKYIDQFNYSQQRENINKVQEMQEAINNHNYENRNPVKNSIDFSGPYTNLRKSVNQSINGDDKGLFFQK